MEKLLRFIQWKQLKKKWHYIKLKKNFKEYRFYKDEKSIKDARKLTNQIWHAYVHYLERNSLYSYAIINDRSWFIVVHGIIAEKTAKECLEILKQAINKYEAPAIFWTDNDGGNSADIITSYPKEK